MKKKLLQLFTVFAAIVTYNSVQAQSYEQLQVSSGFSGDVIANGDGSAFNSSTIGVDNADICFMSTDFKPTPSSTPPAYALPVTGLITSVVTPGLTFQLGPLSGNNSLRAQNQNNGGTLVFSNGVQASRLYVLATSGSGDATISITVNFTDATSQVVPNVLIPDWFFSNALPVASSGFGRVYRNTNVIENPTGDPRLYQYPLELLPGNQLKTIASMQFTKTSSADGSLNVFAVTAELTGTCPSPGGLTAVATANAATVSWSPAILVPAGGYDYYYSTSNTAPTETTEPSGNVGPAVNTVGLSNLNTGSLYYAWVRSNCSATDKGPWVMVTFTPGQISATYTSGDISTLFTASEPSVTTTTTCPGTLSINVPAGYQIASVATSYTMVTASNGWMSEQRSILRCTTTNTAEAAISSGTGNGGTMTYNRTGLTFANGATGTVQFELRAWRTYGGSGCNTTWNRVDNNSWTVTVTYSPLACVTPADPTATPQSLCSGATVANLVATGVAGASFNWYAAATGGTALLSTTLLSSTTYYVSQVVAGCESARIPVVITLTTVAVPTATPQSFCAGSTIANLIATGATGAEFNWYAAATGGTELTSATALTATTYYVSQTVGTCESARTSIAVTINTVAAPIAAPQSFCPGATVTNLIATGAAGAEFNWYAVATGGTELTSATALTATTYYVSQTVGTCESARTSVAVTINTVAVPTSTPQSFCPGATVADLTATGTAGAEFNWYAAATGGTELTSATALTATTYYVSQTVGTCESARTSVVVTINTIAVPTAADQGVCPGSVITDLTVSGQATAAFNWYDTATGGTPLADGTVLIAGTYYVSQTVGTCESEREDVVVTINVTPLPDVEEDTIGCYGITVSDVTGGSDQLHVYTTGTGGTPLAADVLFATGTYYVSQTIDGCESLRAAIDVTIIELEEPIVAADQEFCAGATLLDIDVDYADEADLEWYGTIEGEVLPGTTLLVDGTSYYAVQRAGECESGAAEVVAMVHALPDAPTGMAEQDFNTGETIATLDITAETGATITWYVLDEASDFVVVGTDTVLEDGVNYYVTQKMNGCESDSFVIEANEVLSTSNFGFRNLMVYPNPAADILNVSNDEAITNVTVTNLLGQSVMSHSGESNTMQVNISQLPQGNYILRVYSRTGSASVKIAKQ
jgi:Secretion system C-terminal sorting domain/Ig-like domain CHU_C associated